MKTLIVTDFHYRGGLETFIYNLIESWDKDDTFSILCNEDNPSFHSIQKKLSQKKLEKVIKFNLFIPQFIIKNLKKNNILFKLINYFFFFPYLIISFKIFFLKNDYDKIIVVNGGYPGSIYCRASIISWRIFNKKKSIFNIHNLAKKINYKNFMFEYIIDFFILKSSTHIITVSNSCKNSLDNRFFFRGSQKIKVIYNGLNDFSLDINEDSNIYQKNKGYLLMLATFEERKGYSYLIKALINLKLTHPNFKMKIFGDGSINEYTLISEEIKNNHLIENITIEKFTEDVKIIIKNCKLMLVPSQEDESFGYTIIEAMSLSKPIITTDIGGIPEVLENGVSGYVCSRFNPEQFSSSIKELLNNDDKYEKFSINARNRFINHFKSEKMSKNYKKFLEQDD